jgi:hypothetical protein
VGEWVCGCCALDVGRWALGVWVLGVWVCGGVGVWVCEGAWQVVHS